MLKRLPILKRLPALALLLALGELLLAPARARAEMTATFAGCPCTGGNWPSLTFNFVNNAGYSVQFKGFRFKTPSFGAYTCYGGPAVSVSGSGPYQYEQKAATYDEVRPVGSALNTYSCGAGVPSGKDGTPYDLQLLVKTGACNSSAPLATPTPVSCAQVSAIAADPSYYSSACIPDSLGKNGGPLSGGFIDTFDGQTQIQVGLPAAAYTVNGTNVYFSPATMGGPMYMMASAMAQEYLSVDMQFLMGIGAKEGFAALASSPGGGSYFVPGNASGVNGTYHVEVWTLGRVIMSYPNFFPRTACSAGAPDVTTAATYACVSGDGGWAGVGNWYMCTAGHSCPYIGSNSAQLVNSVFAGGMNFWWIYDALSLSTNLCFKTLLTTGQDPQAAIKIMPAAYNQGINSGFESGILPASAGALAAADITSYTAAGNSNYRDDVMRTATKLAAASSCGGASIYDASITLADLQAFFFGNGGTAASPGDGGLWAHFPNLYSSASARSALWSEVSCAYGALAPHWGGGSISYRYDFLTILRVAKQFLTLNRPYPTQSDFTTWVNSRSTNATACGTSIDSVFPSLAIASPNANTPTAQCPGFGVSFSAADNVMLQNSEWTLDPSWLTWNQASGGAGSYSFSVPGSDPNYPAPGAAGKLWVRVTDSCGNSTIQKLDFLDSCGTPTPTASPTRTPTASPSRTPSPSPTATRTPSPTATPTASASPSSTPTCTRSPSPSGTPTPSASATPTASPSLSPSPTATASRTPTPSPSPAGTLTASPTLSPSPSQTLTATPTASPSDTPSATPTRTATLTASPSPSSTATRTASPSASPSGTPSASPSATPTRSATPTASPTPTLTPSATASPSATPSPTFSPSPSFSPTRTASPTLTTSFTASPTFSHSPTASATRTPLPWDGNLSIVGVYPHPVGPGGSQVALGVPWAAEVEVQVFTLRGEQIQRANFSAGGRALYLWTFEARNQWGRPLAFGSYYLLATARGANGTQSAARWVTVLN